MPAISSEKETSDVRLDSRGQRLLPSVIEQLASDVPEKAWASIPLSADIKAGFKDISFRQLAKVIDALAWWIESRIGRSSTFEPAAYLGNTIGGHLELLNQTDCTKFLYSSGPNVDELIDAKPDLIAFKIPELEELLAEKDAPRYPYDKSFEEAQFDPFMIIHTSGTTGKPRPIVWSHSIYATVDAQSIPETLGGRENIYAPMGRCKRHFSTMPVAHSSSFVRFLRCLLLGVTFVVLPGRAIGTDPESIAIVADVLDYGNVDAAHFVPGILELLSRDSHHLRRLSKLGFIGWGGGPISKSTGEILSWGCKNTVFHNSLGSSDGGAYVTYRTDPEDWEYICYCPYSNGIEWRDHGDGLYEMVVVKDLKLSLFQGPFKIHPKLQEWSTKDLYSKHPTKPYHWRHESRIDDLMVFANGSKFNPARLQSLVQEHPDVWSAVVTAGSTRVRASLIIELRDSEINYGKREEILEEIWNIVLKVNETSPIQGQIWKSLILIAPPTKPFPRASKGTVQITATVELFKTELNDLYEAATA
ncbi:hypothetical protein UA08_08748 [Talaromyces atroroseus]|uniref:AMP-dependent synthetase/ligase domain-containing protein n=1 Tax=Talaromyces atroroseus TaxID=1441469 RepID=A0A225ABI5_TALAT|nr:hypothetical protein UA08_08748 [Talaromyces atroroseus]OKL56143.1 hypothetical protein UA08_08748 [Talaromyces atroroseus]